MCVLLELLVVVGARNSLTCPSVEVSEVNLYSTALCSHSEEVVVSDEPMYTGVHSLLREASKLQRAVCRVHRTRASGACRKKLPQVTTAP